MQAVSNAVRLKTKFCKVETLPSELAGPIIQTIFEAHFFRPFSSSFTQINFKVTRKEINASVVLK